MSLVFQQDSLEVYRVPNGQWILSSVYPDYEKFLDLFKTLGEDVSGATTTMHGRQCTFETPNDWQSLYDDYSKWMLEQFKIAQAPVKELIPRPGKSSWIVDYNPGGYQVGHFHSTERNNQENARFASSVMLFDNIPPHKDNMWDGVLYTLLTDPNGYMYEHKFHSQPGRVVVMDDRVYHGVYPTSKPRKSFVWDFDYKV